MPEKQDAHQINFPIKSKGSSKMDIPVYELFVGLNDIAANQAWKALGEAEQKELLAKNRASIKTVGAKHVVMCNSAWADEEHPWWGVARFPSLEARMAHTRDLSAMGWFDVVRAFTLLGIATEEPAEINLPGSMYKLWILKNNPATAMTASLPAGLDALKWEKHNALYKEFCGQIVLYCNASWCNEAYRGFGISVYPDLEANMKIMDGLNNMGWPGQFDVISYLGIRSKE